ncbi:hypothetical protein RA268_29010, partial [Pseudomonas syringae pv. tagetis]
FGSRMRGEGGVTPHTRAKLTVVVWSAAALGDEGHDMLWALRVMGVEQAVKDLYTGESGVALVDEDKRTAARIVVCGLVGDG